MQIYKKDLNLYERLDIIGEKGLAYKVFEVQFETLQELQDLKKPISIYRRFVVSVVEQIQGSNFNKYADQREPFNPRIQVRIDPKPEANLEDTVHTLQAISIELVHAHIIAACNPSLRDWNEPDFVVKAHETGTKCAVTFKESIDQNPQTYTLLLADVDDFMWKFVIALLRKAGYRPSIIWGLLRNPIPETIEELASDCAPTLLDALENQRPTSSFMERFVHCLFNCTLSQESVRFLPVLQISSIWQKLADDWQPTP